MNIAPPTARAAEVVTMHPFALDEPPSHDRIPEGADDQRITIEPATAPAPTLSLVNPAAWRGVPLPKMRWLATNRIPAGDATILSGDGGGGKTTVALQLAVSV